MLFQKRLGLPQDTRIILKPDFDTPIIMTWRMAKLEVHTYRKNTVLCNTHSMANKSSAVEDFLLKFMQLCRNVDCLVLFQATINKVSQPVLGLGISNHLDINISLFTL